MKFVKLLVDLFILAACIAAVLTAGSIVVTATTDICLEDPKMADDMFYEGFCK